MQFLKDKEKEQLKELVKACLLEISKLKMDLKKCKEGSDDVKEIEDPEMIGEFKDTQLKLEKKEVELVKLQEKLQKKESKISDLEAEIEKEKDVVKSLEDKGSLIKKTVDDKDLHIQQLKADFEHDLENKNQVIAQVREDLEVKIKNLKEESQQKIEDKDLEIKNLQKKIEEKEKKNSGLLEDIEQKNSRVYDLERRSENMDELKNLLDKKEIQINQLQKELEDSASEDKGETVAVLESKLFEFNDKISKMEEELDSFNNELKKKNSQITLLKKDLLKKENEVSNLNESLKEKKLKNIPSKEQDVPAKSDFAAMEEMEEIKKYFELLTARPKKDLTSFQSQVYQLLPFDEGSTKDLHAQITRIAFKELSYENFNFILKNLERKNYVKSYKKDGKLVWKKQEK